ncbi:MAG: hypothetical protein SPK06_00750 [Kiritimatiellia bacterium]|nr:hypothetical protein [Kiritimatiellia bacterium]
MSRGRNIFVRAGTLNLKPTPIQLILMARGGRLDPPGAQHLYDLKQAEVVIEFHKNGGGGCVAECD